ncbi:MAG: hypothetical protein GC149_03895 [Gammaproteobacteria bacterium]|nr:hypothetical protein [Gammaproteobacteria bacterium]
MIIDPIEFEQQLARSGLQYELLSPLGESFCHFRFSGPFQGNLIVWDASLFTLSYYLDQGAPRSKVIRQFIEVGAMSAQGRLIRIGLNLAKIDEPAVLKTRIMIRQYKRLAAGRHEFGEPLQFTR